MWGPRLNLHQSRSRCNPAVTWGVKHYILLLLAVPLSDCHWLSNHCNVNPALISCHVPTQGTVSSGHQQFSCFPSHMHPFFIIILCILKAPIFGSHSQGGQVHLPLLSSIHSSTSTQLPTVNTNSVNFTGPGVPRHLVKHLFCTCKSGKYAYSH